MTTDSFKSRATLRVAGQDYEVFRLDSLTKAGLGDISTLPYSIRILLENLLRFEDGKNVTRNTIEAVAKWDPTATPSDEILFTPARVVLQDFTGVPCVVDLAAMREAFAKMGGDPARINPLSPVDLVIDHSVQVDSAGTLRSFDENVRLEFERNIERYQFLKWGQQAFRNMRVVPPGTGIVHQVNLEYLATGVATKTDAGKTQAYPDSLVGTDSHTTMINGLGVLGWGVGGIEAEAAMLGQPIAMLVPQVIGFGLAGKLREGATATDLVLTVTQMLRKKGVVGKFVEFYGSGLDALSLPDRATIANMAPEYGATMGFFPVDTETLAYMRLTGRPAAVVELTEAYCRAQGLFRTAESPTPRFTDTLELDLSTVVPSVAGPKRPQDRVPLTEMKRNWRRSLVGLLGDKLGTTDTAAVDGYVDGKAAAPAHLATTTAVTTDGTTFNLTHGSVVISAITSCTNTSNPSVLIGAGLVAKKANALGLRSKPWVKTSLAPGSQVVTEYLRDAGLLSELEQQGFFLVGYGCTTCIGNSGPVHEAIADAVKKNDLVVSSVLSGNRNFEGRVNPSVRANYLASPPLCVAYAIAGTTDIDFDNEPLGKGSAGQDVYLKDIWPTQQEINEASRKSVRTEFFTERYSKVLEGTKEWQDVQAPAGTTFDWDDKSTYIRKPNFFEDMARTPAPVGDIIDARVLVMVSDSVTTDHISPAGNIATNGPAAKYLQDNGVAARDFNQYGARRGNHEVMVRGTFANIRLRNLIAPGTEGGVTRHLPSGDGMSIFDASVRYRTDNVPTIVIAGQEYGTGSSRDWAAKGPFLLGVRAAIAQSFERIHRSNLIGMGILPLEFLPTQSRESLGLTGEEVFSITGVSGDLVPGKRMTVTAGDKVFQVIARLDTPQEVDYYKHGGILQYVLRSLL